MVSSVMNIGVAGIQSGMNSLARSGQQIANANRPPEQGGPDNLLEPIVAQMQATYQVKANARVVEAGAETLGTLIDIKV